MTITLLHHLALITSLSCMLFTGIILIIKTLNLFIPDNTNITRRIHIRGIHTYDMLVFSISAAIFYSQIS